MKFISKILKIFLSGSSSFSGARLRLFNFAKFQRFTKFKNLNFKVQSSKFHKNKYLAIYNSRIAKHQKWKVMKTKVMRTDK